MLTNDQYPLKMIYANNNKHHKFWYSYNHKNIHIDIKNLFNLLANVIHNET